MFLFFSWRIENTESWPRGITYHATSHPNQPISAKKKTQQLTSADGSSSLSVESWNFTWKYQWILKEKSIMSEKRKRRKISPKFSSNLLRSKMKILTTLFITIFGSGKPPCFSLIFRKKPRISKEKKKIPPLLIAISRRNEVSWLLYVSSSHIHERS